MSGAPPVGPGQLSPDAKWQWDGTRWVPAQPQVTTRRRSRAWVWVLAGCLTVVVLTVAGVGYGIYSFVQSVKNGSASCLPSDFPRYPGATFGGVSFELNGTYPGNTCHATFESNDGVPTVTAYYQSALNTGAWQVTPIGNPADSVTFQSSRSRTPFGTVQVAVAETHTEITIVVYSSTCLPLTFPMYPGARFGGQNAGPGATSAGTGCHLVLVTNDSVAAVTAFYRAELTHGSWQVTSSAAGQVGFRLKNGDATIRTGTVASAVIDDRTEINIDVYP